MIEHVHSPLKVMTSVHRLLKPGGVVYVETPNIDSCGAKFFGANWRGLETPRHLLLFNPDSLQKILAEIGFDHIDLKRHTSVMKVMYLSSLRMVQGKSPYESDFVRLPIMESLRIKKPSLKRKNLEFITLTAIKRRL